MYPRMDADDATGKRPQRCYALEPSRSSGCWSRSSAWRCQPYSCARPRSSSELSSGRQGVASHSISGVLLDPSGAAIPKRRGCSAWETRVEILAQTTTDAVGAFHLDNIAPGKYTLEFHAEGFRDTRVAAAVTPKRVSPLRIVLPISVETENVTVATGVNVPVVSTETSDNQNANAIDRDALDRVPVFDQDYITTMSRFLDDNATGTNGVTLVVNGIEANGPGVTPSAVQEVKINNNPYSARFSRPGRARLEIVTKSGSPDYHGSLNFMFRDSVFDASNAFAVVKPPESRQYYEGSVTGPIGHSKRTSFLLSLDEDLLDQQDIIDTQCDCGGRVSRLRAPLRRRFPTPPITFSGPAASSTIWPMEISSGSATPTSIAPRTIQNVGGTMLPSAATDTRFLEHEINVSYLHQFSPHWLNQARFLVGHYDSPVASILPDAQITVSGLFTAGGAQGRFSPHGIPFRRHRLRHLCQRQASSSASASTSPTSAAAGSMISPTAPAPIRSPAPPTTLP